MSLELAWDNSTRALGAVAQVEVDPKLEGSTRSGATTGAPESLHYAGADRWVSMPNGAQASRGRGRASVEAGPTPAPWRSAPSFLIHTPTGRQWINWALSAV